MGKIEILNKYNNLSLIQEVEPFIQPSGQKNRAFLCKCDCGKEKVVRLIHLRKGRVKSCGCIKGERHGHSNTKLYKAWLGIKTRTSKSHPERHLYFDRGITVCKEWSKSFEKFKEWAIENNWKHKLHIDRIDGSKGYCPENCRIVQPYINMNNRDKTLNVIYGGKQYAFTDLLFIKGLELNEAAIRARIKRGWNHDEAFDKPIKTGRYHRLHYTLEDYKESGVKRFFGERKITDQLQII